MAKDWQCPGDAVCPDEPTCMYCGKICKTTEVIYTGDDESYGGFELWCWCEDCQEDTFHKMIKEDTYIKSIKQKVKVLDAINDFVSFCHAVFKLDVGDFAKRNFTAIVENFWDCEKSDKENLEKIKQMLETNKKLNEISGCTEVVELIKTFQDGWLNKIKV